MTGRLNRVGWMPMLDGGAPERRERPIPMAESRAAATRAASRAGLCHAGRGRFNGASGGVEGREVSHSAPDLRRDI